MAIKVATFTTKMQLNDYGPAAPAPTQWRARAVSAANVTKSQTLPYGTPADGQMLDLPIGFNDASEAGPWQCYLELWAGSTKLDEKGPITIVVPTAPVAVKYLGPGSFTVTVQ